jgi:hypothetical protein
MDAVFGILLVLIVGIVTWCVASEGAWGAGITFLCVVFSGLLAMNFFEPVADLFGPPGSMMWDYADVVSLLGLFALFVFLGRLATDAISPTQIDYDARIYNVARWLFGLATGYTTMAIVLTALHTAPLPRNFLGFSPERDNLFDIAAPDRQWLGFTQRVSEKILATGAVFDGPRYAEPETPQDIWPSFPIRYATRRQDYSRPRGSATGGVQVTPASGSAPSGAPPAGGAPPGPTPGSGPPPRAAF